MLGDTEDSKEAARERLRERVRRASFSRTQQTQEASDSEQSTLPGMGMNKGTAFVVGLFAAAFTSQDSWGMLGILFMPLVFGFMSGVAVLLAVFFGVVLEMLGLERWWHRREFPALAVLTIGITLLLLGVSNAQLDPSSGPEEPSYIYGPTRWPGYFLLVAAIANYPRKSEASASSSTVG